MAACSRRRRPARRWVKSRAVVMVPVSPAIPRAPQTHTSAPGRENASRDAARGPSAASVQGRQRSAARAVLPAAALGATGNREKQRQAITAARRGAPFVGAAIHRTSPDLVGPSCDVNGDGPTGPRPPAHGHVRTVARSRPRPAPRGGPRGPRPAAPRLSSPRPHVTHAAPLASRSCRDATPAQGTSRTAPFVVAQPRNPIGVARPSAARGRRSSALTKARRSPPQRAR